MSSPFGSPGFDLLTNADGIAKLLMFGAYVRAQVEMNSGSRNLTVRSLVETELAKFNYTRKAAFKEPYFSPVDLSHEHDYDFYPALTDSGVCNVYNGQSLRGTYKPEMGRTGNFAATMDPRMALKEAKKINGTGKIAEMSFWLNVADK